MLPYVLVCILVYILLVTVTPLSGETPSKESGAYSGFYAADIIHTSEDYAGAWLIGMYTNVAQNYISAYCITMHYLRLPFSLSSIAKQHR